MFIFISCSISCFLEATKRIRKGKFICLHASFRLLIIYFRWPPPQSANTANVIIVSKLICFSIGPRGSCAVRHVTISSLPDDIIVFVVIGLGGPIWKAKRASSTCEAACERRWKLSGFYINLVHLIKGNMSWWGATTVVEAVGGVWGSVELVYGDEFAQIYRHVERKLSRIGEHDLLQLKLQWAFCACEVFHFYRYARINGDLL